MVWEISRILIPLFSFAKKHNVEVSLTDLPKYMEQAKQLGFIK